MVAAIEVALWGAAILLLVASLVASETGRIALVHELAEARTREAYWQARAERFLDIAAGRAGVAHEPVMGPPKTVESFNPFGGLGMTSFDSTKVNL